METKQIQEQTTSLGCVETAKLVRKALKETFSSQKFSVTSSQYAGGASIDVSWTDGIPSDEVNKLCKQFSGSGFDGMVDYKYSCSHWIMPDGSIRLAHSEGSQDCGGYSPEYKSDKPHPDAKKVSFGADYVFAQRTISEDALKDAAKQIAKLNELPFDGDMNDTPKTGFFEARGDCWWNIARQLLCENEINGSFKIVRSGETCSGSWTDFYKVLPIEEENQEDEEETIKQERMARYKERQEAKEARYLKLSEKASRQSIASQEASHRATENIPFGQPILVGHHSERAHRNAIKRSWNAMDKAVELSNKADYYAQKADATKNNNAISSDNPEAIDLLKKKLTKLEEQRTGIKEFNKIARKEKKDSHPGWMLSNLGQNITSVKKRIKHLESLEKIEEIEEKINGVVLKTNKEDNRVRLFFDGKPDDEIRTILKRNGFRWSPYNGCWQRQLNAWSIKIARELLQGGQF